MSLTTYSILVLVLVLAVCVELGDAATAVDAYRLIQYDLDGAPYGSRLAALNHFAGVAPFASGVDLSRTAVILPLRDLNFTLLHGEPQSLLLLDLLGTNPCVGKLRYFRCLIVCASRSRHVSAVNLNKSQISQRVFA